MRIVTRILIPAVLAVGAALPAGAVTYTATPGAPDGGPLPGQSILVDFNGALPDGYTLDGSYGLTTGTAHDAASPAGDNSQYFYTSSKIGNGTATLTTFDLSSVSFYWGSIDSYNTVDILGAGGVTLLSVGGAVFQPASGDQSLPITNQRISFFAEGDEVITGLRFNSTGIAFEIDDVAGQLVNPGNPGGTVPEPATWAMMLGGFGMVGFAARRRQKVTTARVAA